MIDAKELESLRSAANQNLMENYALMARLEDSPDGFEAFFQVINGKELLRHSREQVEGIYSARAEGKYTGIEAFRGSAKTTVMVTFFAYRIGLEPHRANLLIQVGDDIAQDNAERVADIIAYNPGWKMVFPNVVPDTEKGWGAGGYEVKRTDIPYPEWRKINSERKDPTFLGLGYKSRAIIGKRPDGILLVDDILDENNTASEREMQTVDSILTGTIFPTMTKDTWLIFCYTPWKENDPVVKQTRGESFKLIKTPVYKTVGHPTPFQFHGDYIELTWPERFDIAEIEKRLRISGTIEFARMYLLFFSKGYNRVLKFQ